MKGDGPCVCVWSEEPFAICSVVEAVVNGTPGPQIRVPWHGYSSWFLQKAYDLLLEGINFALVVNQLFNLCLQHMVSELVYSNV
jgi:hypothetical protein